MTRSRCLPLFALLISSPALADGNDIIVRGGGLPLPPGTPAYDQTEVNRDRLVNAASSRIENLLGDVAGFQQFRRSDSRASNPTAQGATLRALGGNASSRALVLLDGVPMADPFFGHIPYSALVPERLSGVRVTRGGGVGAFGSGAVAGTIEMASATRDQLPLLSATGFYGSRASTELSGTFAPSLGEGYAMISGRWDRGDGFQTTPVSQRIAGITVPARYKSWSTSGRVVQPLSDTLELQANALVFRDHRTLRFRGADNSSKGEDFSLRLVSQGPWAFDAVAYGQHRNFTNIVIASSAPYAISLDQRDTPATGLGGKIELRPPVGSDHVLRLGGDMRHAKGDMYEDAYRSGNISERRHASGNQTVAGLFIEDSWTLGPVVLTGGARADHWTINQGELLKTDAGGTPTSSTFYPNRSGWESSLRAGAVYRPSDAVALRGAAYTGFRLPTLNELYRGFKVFPIDTFANANLQPEKLKGVEIGTDVTPLAGVKLSATLFYNRLEDAIANVTLTPTTRQRQNVDAIVARGIELGAEARTGNVVLNASYAYTHSRVHAPGLAFDGFIPAQTPRHAASATIGWMPADGPSFSATMRYVDRQYEDDLQTDVLRHALTIDGYARLPVIKGVAVIGRVENLFDAQVMTRNAGGSIDLGTPRTFWIGMRFER